MLSVVTLIWMSGQKYTRVIITSPSSSSYNEYPTSTYPIKAYLRIKKKCSGAIVLRMTLRERRNQRVARVLEPLSKSRVILQEPGQFRTKDYTTEIHIYFRICPPSSSVLRKYTTENQLVSYRVWIKCGGGSCQVQESKEILLLYQRLSAN